MSSIQSFPLHTLRSETSYTPVPLFDDSKDGDHNTDSQTALFNTSGDLNNLSDHRWWKHDASALDSHTSTGWHFGAKIALLQANTVLLINVIILIYSAVKIGGATSGVGPVFTGDCDTVERLTIGIHLVINVLSTLLLGASNYVMQSLCAPTRTGIDSAHERGEYLDIGLQSMRNLAYTSRWKRVLWFLLAASSIPLHLFYNSSFFSTLGANVYNQYVAIGPDIQQIPKNNGTFDWRCSSEDRCPESGTRWEFLTATECLDAYAVDFLSGRRDVVVVGNYTDANDGFNLYGGGIPYGAVNSNQAGLPLHQYDWLCSGTADSESRLCINLWREIDPFAWRVQWPGSDLPPPAYNGNGYFQVQYCLSEMLPTKCQLQSNLPLLALVIFFNTVKAICIAVVTTRLKDHPLVTIGDAIASFVDSPQPRTKQMCLVSYEHFRGQSGIYLHTSSMPIRYANTRRIRWIDVASRRHWIVTVCLFLGSIAIILSLLGVAISELRMTFGINDLSSLWQLGIGNTTAETIIQGSGWIIPSQGYGALVASVLIANSPQLILSLIYLVFNSLCTKLCLALEWASYAHSRKPLRVSSPRGDQRSTYFLQIPYRFGVPLMAYSALLHWLLSQSIFLVSVTYWTHASDEAQDGIISCGFSPLAMVLTSVVAASLILAAIVCGYFKHLDGTMPLVSSCSTAIAAACHSPESGSDVLKPLKWGVVESHDGRDPEHAVGHISFSSGKVVRPIPGCYYS